MTLQTVLGLVRLSKDQMTIDLINLSLVEGDEGIAPIRAKETENDDQGHTTFNSRRWEASSFNAAKEMHWIITLTF